jgi:predicted RNA-binding protein with PIN domain
MISRKEIVLEFMVALASNENIHKKTDVGNEHENEHYADVFTDAAKLADTYIELIQH